MSARWFAPNGDTMLTLTCCLTKADFATDTGTVTSSKRYQTEARQDTFPIPSAIPSKMVRLLGASACLTQANAPYISTTCDMNLLADDCE